MAKVEEHIPSYITMFSGAHVDPLDLRPEDILVEDIAHHLSNQCRWSGGTRYHYSVAQHSYYCSLIVPSPFAYDALHHDDAEAYLQDMAKPLKNNRTLGQAYRGAEQRIERVIREALGVTFPFPDPVKQADLAMLIAEAEQLVHGRKHWSYYHEIEAADIEIKKWTPEKAEKKWLARHAELFAAKEATV